MTKNEVIYVAKPTWYTEQIYPGHVKFYENFVAQLKQYHEVRALARGWQLKKRLEHGVIIRELEKETYDYAVYQFVLFIAAHCSGYFGI